MSDAKFILVVFVVLQTVLQVSFCAMIAMSPIPVSSALCCSFLITLMVILALFTIYRLATDL